MVVSSTTTLFQIRRQRNNTGTYYIKLLFITLLLGMLAYLASRNAVLCVLSRFPLRWCFSRATSSRQRATSATP